MILPLLISEDIRSQSFSHHSPSVFFRQRDIRSGRRKDVAHSLSRLEADASSAGFAGRECQDHHGRHRLARLLQFRRNHYHASVVYK